jgi:hypothetical protein
MNSGKVLLPRPFKLQKASTGVAFASDMQRSRKSCDSKPDHPILVGHGQFGASDGGSAVPNQPLLLAAVALPFILVPQAAPLLNFFVGRCEDACATVSANRPGCFDAARLLARNASCS